ncbi:MAG: hypothetical protein Ct9H300mP11_25480 [Chloroflexota bacterium]|nr:MAG: hypothetical protein Ct9H300mP11_25480 [Chloroflexota bacterium]
MDEEHSRRRGFSTDETVHIGFNHVDPEDVELLRESLNLSDVAASAAYNLREKYGEDSWLKEFLDVGRKVLCWIWQRNCRLIQGRYALYIIVWGGLPARIYGGAQSH